MWWCGVVGEFFDVRRIGKRSKQLPIIIIASTILIAD